MEEKKSTPNNWGGKRENSGGKRKGAGRPKKEQSEKRTLNWNILVYPTKEELDKLGSDYDGSDGYGTAPLKWRDIIDEMHIEWVESPLHDRDINDTATNEDGTGKYKKPHYHVTLLFPSVKTYEQVKEITDKLNAPRPERCNSVKGSIRYMAHKDHPDKAQYNWNDIKCHGGADLTALCAATAMERLQIQTDILDYIDNNNIFEYSDIVRYSIDNGFTDWTNVLLNFSTLSISTYIRSRRHKAEKGVPQAMKVDSETGEVIE